ncbi:MAG: restriction endonuclease [Gemmatimonadales bacterium]
MPDLEQAASDQIVEYIRRVFPGHDMARVVAAVLEAEGMHVTVSAPGPDGGADIFAGSGPLGLDSPRICVQVKATAGVEDVKVLRELNGTMQAFGAEQGLLVCWSGVTKAAFKEARQHSFRIRIWDQDDLVRAIYRAYDKLPAEMQAELPLKRVWMLVREDAGGAE